MLMETSTTPFAPLDAATATATTTTPPSPGETTADMPNMAMVNVAVFPPTPLRISPIHEKQPRRDPTPSTCHRAVLSEASSESDELDEDLGDSEGLASDDILVKPMSMLPVCPLDDLAVEEEKRRRRNVRMMKKAKNARRNCADAESLPSPTSPLVRQVSNKSLSSEAVSMPRTPRTPTATPMLRRDSMTIRQQYWKQLGISMSQRDLERNTGRRRERRQGVKVPLNDARAHRGKSKNIFQIIAGWYGAADDSKDKEKDKLESPTSGNSTDSSSTTESMSSPRRKAVRFDHEAELFYIPLHKDYSKRQRDCMWHTRTEFVSMVERNLDEVYEEMEREYEEQLEAERLENERMAEEEARQREIETQRAAKAAAASAAALLSPPLNSTPRSGPNGSPGSSPPGLSLCPIATQVKLTPRARSPHDIRFKYLKHLGINQVKD
ncbi:hypothetical protein PINS_up002536 [Pythium insidiosum]|nr:hypothetical protein PINS_up002536 [Pythium insidiosum]